MLQNDAYCHDRERIEAARARIQAHMRWRREQLEAYGVRDYSVIESDGRRVGEFIASKISGVETQIEAVEVTEQLAEEIPKIPLYGLDDAEDSG